MEVLWPAAGAMVGLFDTQIAAALIGLPAQIGYGDLVSQLLGHNLHKSQTRTDWSRRPLTEEQLAYALDDVRYLPALAQALQGRLEQLGRWHWFEEEMAQLDSGASFQVVRGIPELDAGRGALARALAAWRERRAIAADRPRNWILPDAALRDIVLSVPRTLDEFTHIAELPEGIRRRAGPTILALIESLELPARLPPLAHPQRPPQTETDAVQRLAHLTRQTGRELGIAPEILATRRQMQRLVAGERDAAPLTGWRRAVIGERLLSAL
jgi:ribonuclease D